MKRQPSEIRDGDVTVYPIQAEGIPANRLGRCTVPYSSTRVSPFNMYSYDTMFAQYRTAF